MAAMGRICVRTPGAVSLRGCRRARRGARGSRSREGRRSRPAAQVRIAGSLGSVRDAELAVDVREVELDRLLGHPELRGDAPIREPRRYVPEDLLLARREA